MAEPKTGSDILKSVASVLSENTVAPYKPYAVEWINLLIEEMFRVNNRLRRSKGLPEFEVPPTIYSINETIDYEWELTRAFVYGVCKLIYLQENDPALLSLYSQEYAMAVNDVDVGWLSFG